MPQRTLSEAEFNAVRDQVLAAMPSGYTEAEFNRQIGPRMEAALGEAENTAAVPEQTAGRFLSSLAHTFDPRPAFKLAKDFASAATIGSSRPLYEDIKGIVGSQVDQAHQAADAYHQGRYVEAAGHAGASGLPLLGPAAAASGEKIGQGDVAGGAGEGVGLVTGVLAPSAIAKVRGVPVRVPGLSGPTNRVAAEALAFGERSGVPIDAGTATGNRFVQAAQHMADRSMGGSVVADRAATGQQAGLATVGEQLAAKAHGTATTAEQAGQGVRDAVLDNVRTHSADANAAYDKLRTIEADPAHARQVVVGEKPATSIDTGVLDASGQPVIKTTPAKPITETMPLPVDLRGVKVALKPIYDELMARYPVAQQEASKGLKALQNIINGPDHAPLSTVDANLGAIKSIARSDLPELRSVSQGTAAGAVKQLEAAVQQTAASAGPDAVAALQAGRTATIAKYGAADVLDSLRAEPVKVHGQLTAPGDGAIAQLRQVAQQAPGELPKIGRAVLDGLLEKATSEGGFGHTAKIAADWERLGEETKRLLYKDPGYISDLDNFFRLAKQTSHNANPSGTAHAVAISHQGAALTTSLMTLNPIPVVVDLVGTYGLAKLFHTRAGVRLLTKGLRIPVGNKAAIAAWTTEAGALTSPNGSRTQSLAPAQ